MDTLAKFVPNKNPHAIKDLGTANACLDAVNNIKPINK